MSMFHTHPRNQSRCKNSMQIAYLQRFKCGWVIIYEKIKTSAYTPISTKYNLFSLYPTLQRIHWSTSIICIYLIINIIMIIIVVQGET